MVQKKNMGNDNLTAGIEIVSGKLRDEEVQYTYEKVSESLDKFYQQFEHRILELLNVDETSKITIIIPLDGSVGMLWEFLERSGSTVRLYQDRINFIFSAKDSEKNFYLSDLPKDLNLGTILILDEIADKLGELQGITDYIFRKLFPTRSIENLSLVQRQRKTKIELWCAFQKSSTVEKKFIGYRNAAVIPFDIDGKDIWVRCGTMDSNIYGKTHLSIVERMTWIMLRLKHGFSDPINEKEYEEIMIKNSPYNNKRFGGITKHPLYGFYSRVQSAEVGIKFKIMRDDFLKYFGITIES